ncbi:hypothetical protein GPJ56_011010 [Histomonas meleagridis]|uniref:uncharacterized protein n=1 Tax=Histomonas meleagridis TaxID=135588 RepID=UPI003559F2A5|nr:hypothetical protein GPJ56_011010 [Histomonas meleagridis]KAH0800787.1 hypothetical protein GO595_006540 [Histomonas meleagridis]
MEAEEEAAKKMAINQEIYPEAEIEADLPPDTLENFAISEDKPESVKLKIPWVAIIVCGALVVFFTILFFCTFFVPSSQYNKNKKENPNLEYMEVPASVIVLHWVTYFCFIGLIISIPLVIISVQYFHVEDKYFSVTLCFLIFFSVAVCSLWIVYPILVYATNIVFYAWYERISQAQYEQAINNISGTPYLIFKASTSYLNRVKGLTYEYVRCTAKEIKYNITNYSAIYNITEFTKDSYFKIDLMIDETQEQKDYITKFAEMYKLALPQTSSNGNSYDWDFKYGVQFEYQTNGTYFVTKDGTLEGQYAPQIGKTMMAFWSGAGYAYRLGSLPFRYSSIKISNMTFDAPEIPSDTDKIWEEIHNPECISKMS